MLSFFRFWLFSTPCTATPVCFAIVLLLASASAAQDPTAGIQLFSTSATAGTVDRLDLATSNIFISIPVRSKTSGVFPFSFALVSNSHAWGTEPAGPPFWQISGFFGPLTGPWGAMLLNGTAVAISCRNQTPDVEYSDFSVKDATGVSHFLSPTVATYENGCYPLPQGAQAAVDGSGYTVIFTGPGTANIYDKFGNQVSGATLSDPDGNTIKFSVSGQDELYTDSLGTTAITYLPGGGSGAPDKYWYTDSGGNTQTVQISYSSFTQQTNFGCTGIKELDQSNSYLPTSITLPGGEQYGISYELTPGYNNSSQVTGRIAKITLPSGWLRFLRIPGWQQRSPLRRGSGADSCSNALRQFQQHGKQLDIHFRVHQPSWKSIGHRNRPRRQPDCLQLCGRIADA